MESPTEAKAHRLIADGALHATVDTEAEWKGTVTGDTGTYTVEYLFDEGSHSCTCLSHRNRGWCSHVLAVLLRTHAHAHFARGQAVAA